MWIVLSQVWGWELAENLHCDNAAAVSAAKSGVYKKLAYMRRTQRVSIGFVADYIGGANTQLTQVETTQQWADLFTKALDAVLHTKMLTELGIG